MSSFQLMLEKSGVSPNSTGTAGLTYLFLSFASSLGLEPIEPGEESPLPAVLNRLPECGGLRELKRHIGGDNVPPADPVRCVRVAKAEAEAALARVTEAEAALEKFNVEEGRRVEKEKKAKAKAAKEAVKEAEVALSQAEAEVAARERQEAEDKVAPVTRAKAALARAKAEAKAQA